MIDALMKAKKPVDVLILPEQPHVPESDGYGLLGESPSSISPGTPLGSQEAAGLEKKIAPDERIVPIWGIMISRDTAVPCFRGTEKTLILVVPGQPEYELAPERTAYLRSPRAGLQRRIPGDEAAKSPA